MAGWGWMMSNERPRVLVVGDIGGGAQEVSRVLSSDFDVVRTAASVVDRVSLAQFAMVLAAPSELGSLGLAASGQVSEGQAIAILSAIGEGVCLTTHDGEVVWANDRFRGFEDQVRSRVAAVCRQAGQVFGDQMLTQEPSSYAPTARYDISAPDESRYFEVVVAPISSDLGQPGRVAAIVWDVTQSRRFQHKMDAIDRAGAELVRLDAEAIRKKHVADRLKVLEDKIIRFSQELLRFDQLAIRLIDERTGRLELVIARGLSKEAMEVELYAQKEGNGIMGYAAATGRSYLCPDVRKDRRYVTGMPGAKSSLTVPLRIHDRVIGAFNVESELIAAFTEEDRQFAEMFATHVAMALYILDLLVIERCATGETVTGTVRGELIEPLNDIIKEAGWLREAAERDPSLKEHIDRILVDVAAIRQRVNDAASGPQTILGADKMLLDIEVDPRLKGRRVLVADDEPKIRDAVRSVLRGKGCSVVVCKDGAHAIAELQAAAEGGGGGSVDGPYELVISDIKMPDRNGYEVFSVAKSLNADVPVILMTGFGYDPHHSIVRASQEGLQCVLFKPFQIERLMEEVYKALGVEQGPVSGPMSGLTQGADADFAGGMSATRASGGSGSVHG